MLLQIEKLKGISCVIPTSDCNRVVYEFQIVKAKVVSNIVKENAFLITLVIVKLEVMAAHCT